MAKINCIAPDGRTFASISAMCAAFGIGQGTYSSRIRAGWDPEKALLYRPGSVEAKIYNRTLHCIRENRAEAYKNSQNAYTVPVSGISW
jgi:hypothetical protein